jgi:hypothetical protein
MAKVIPVQFSPPSLVSLVTPLGDFTRMRVLWLFMGTSTAYIIFTGLVEVAGGLLLLSPRTTRLGAMILAAAFVNVAMLNFGYEVGVQLNSTIYALMAITLLAPDARRLATAFFGGSFMAEESPRRASLVGRLLNAVVVIALLGVNFHSAWEMRQSAVQRPALYGIYDVEDLELDDVRVPATEGTRWRRVIIGERGTSAIQWTPDGRLDQFVVTEDPDGKTLAFTPRGSETPKFTLEYARDADGRVSVTGRFDDRRVRARLKPIDVAATFPLRRPRR